MKALDKCPLCGNAELIESQQKSSKIEIVIKKVHCHECLTSWNEYYELYKTSFEKREYAYTKDTVI